jgi:hypothetical protein
VKHGFLDHEDVAFPVTLDNGNEILTLGDFLNPIFLEHEKVVIEPPNVQKMPFDHS